MSAWEAIAALCAPEGPRGVALQLERDRDALAQIVTWAAHRGSIGAADEATMRALVLAANAAVTAAESARELEALTYLATQWLHGGGPLIEVVHGLELRRRVLDRASARGVRVACERPSLVRVLAGEAMATRGAFWERALAGAQPQEPREVTTTRLRAAATTDEERSLVDLVLSIAG